ncbi:MAG: hypothetical protein AAGF67_04605, partial [Verrucomicrobiota bacterium]
QDPDRATPGPDEKLVIQCSPVDTRQIIRIRLEKNRWIFPQEGGRDSYSGQMPLEPGSTKVEFSVADLVDAEKVPMENWDRITQFDVMVIDLEDRAKVDQTDPETTGLLEVMSWE